MYTPAPWNIQPFLGHGNSRRLIICAPDHDNRVAVISLDGAPKGDNRNELQNAQLISAAPDMLEALEFLISAHEEHMLSIDEWENAKRAVCKARGLKFDADDLTTELYNHIDNEDDQ